jgi:hypothetical protein
VGHVLTEFTSGRIIADPKDANLVQLTGLQRGFLDNLARVYLAGENPLLRYRRFWQNYYKSPAFRLEMLGGGNHKRTHPFDLHREVISLERVVLAPADVHRYWQRSGIAADVRDVPRVCYMTEDTFGAALAEVWWCVEHQRTARQCKGCAGWFIPSGVRHWLQRYCSVCREEGSAARQRARRRAKKKDRR